MEPIVSSETSAIRTQTLGNYPKRNNLHLEHGESLRTIQPSLHIDKNLCFKLHFELNLAEAWILEVGVVMMSWIYWALYIQYILESNPHLFYSFRGLKNQMRIRMACGLESRAVASWILENDRAAVRAVRTIQYNNLFYLLFIILYNI